MYEQGNQYIHLLGDKEGENPAKHCREFHNHTATYEERYLPAVWKNITPEEIKAVCIV